MTTLTRKLTAGMVCRELFTSHESQPAVFATRLPCCSQYACIDCVSSWHNPSRHHLKNTCFHCRAILFAPVPNVDTVEGLIGHLEILRWWKQTLEVPSDTPKLFQDLNELSIKLFDQRLSAAVYETRGDLLGVDDWNFTAEVGSEKRLVQQELWLRWAIILYISIKIGDSILYFPIEDREEAERSLLTALECARLFSEFGEQIEEVVE